MTDPKRDQHRLEGLKAALDKTTEWPTVYTYKFIVPRASLNHLLALIDGNRYSSRESKTGKFVSVTMERVVTSSEDVIELYKRTAVVKGLMAL